MNEPTCPKCNSDMEEGFVIEVPKGANHAVATYQCTQCRYLESYARPE